MDTLRERGNLFIEHHEQGKPAVLKFDHELLIDGRTLEHPVNYNLLRILPEPGVEIDPDQRPFVVVDPRAGHGPGIGGSKYDSQVGVAMRAGHPVYFVTFRPEPEPGQTLLDVGRAEALFLEEVARRHPGAPKPCVIGNCQAGWAVAMLAAVRPELMGPIVLNGAPLSYWAGVEDKNPMRYTGGLLGGKWLATLTSDLGNGKFDGAWLVHNFENLNPANTLWSKQYNLYSRIDSEGPRYLDFEKWWGGFFLLNAEEMDFIVNNLFIGNKLGRGAIQLPDGRFINLLNIRAPIVIFASFGDNITPPQQALNWIVDVYRTDEDILKDDQVIVYTLHEEVGHLGIFVSGGVACKQHAEFVNTMDMIEILPPGLYEMVIENKNPFVRRADLIKGDYVVRFERRKLDDIRALDDGRRDEDYFTSVAAVSDINDQMYRMFLQPWVKLFSNEQTARILRAMHPNRMNYYLWSDMNPWLAPIKALAEQIRENRRPVVDDNYYATLERDQSENIVNALNAYRDFRDNLERNVFKAIYGPFGFGALFPAEPVEVPLDPEREAAAAAEIERLRNSMEEGGLGEAVTRIVMAAVLRMGMIDHRTFAVRDEIRQMYPKEVAATPEQARQRIRDQFFMLVLDEDRAIRALAKLLPTREDRVLALETAGRLLMIEGADLHADGPLVRKLCEGLELDVPELVEAVAQGEPA
jgi:hypothetical protein